MAGNGLKCEQICCMMQADPHTTINIPVSGWNRGFYKSFCRKSMTKNDRDAIMDFNFDGAADHFTIMAPPSLFKECL